MTAMIPEFGLMSADDARLIATVLDHVASRFSPPTRILEIGVREGQTSRGIAAYMGSRPFEYHGIDNQRDMAISPPFGGATLHLGDSAAIHAQIPGPFHFLLIDGCHCHDHVVGDMLHYGEKIATGGIVVFHDTDPRVQGRDYQGHGPEDSPAFHIAVLQALKTLDLDRNTNWRLIAESRADERWGGARAYERVA